MTLTEDPIRRKLLMCSMSLFFHSSSLDEADSVLRMMIILFSSPECTYDTYEYVKAFADCALMESEKGDDESNYEENGSFEPDETILENSFHQHFF